MTAKSIADAAHAPEPDPVALAVYAQCGTRLGQALAVLVDVLNPECIVLGSVFARSGDLLIPSMQRVLSAECLPDSLAVCRILPPPSPSPLATSPPLPWQWKRRTQGARRTPGKLLERSFPAPLQELFPTKRQDAVPGTGTIPHPKTTGGNNMLSHKPTFGPGGNGGWFYRDGGKSTVQAPAWLEKIGLDAYEYEAGRGVVAGEESLRAVGEAAAAHGIRMSLHAPYFISLSGAVEEKRLASIDYIRKSLWAAELLGADTIVIHSGSAGKMSRAEAMRLSCDTLARVMQAVGDTTIRLGIETMGKVNQLGTLDEVIEQCRVDPHYHPWWISGI